MKIIIACIAIVLWGSAFSQPVVSIADFKPAIGSWKGTLTDQDNTSGKRFTKPVNMVLSVVDMEHVILSFDYTKEPTANSNDTIVISKDGTDINGIKVTSREIMEDGSVKIIIEINFHGESTLRTIYVIGKNSFQYSSWIKLAKNNANTWTKLNEYLFNR